MKEGIKHFFEKMPALYRFIAKGYSYTLLRFRYLKYLLSGTKVTEKEWTTRHLRKSERKRDDWGKENNDWIESYRDSLHHQHRPFLIEKISKFNPSSILEIGCNCGPNLYLLSKRLPNAVITGIDINSAAIQEGRKWFREEKIHNVTLLEGKADNIQKFETKYFDVILTDATLIYIGPDKIEQVISDMCRVGKTLVLVEWYDFENKQNAIGAYYLGIWKRNYATLLSSFYTEDHINVTKIDSNIWNDQNWMSIGAIIEAWEK